MEATYAQAHELCQQVGETPQIFPTLRGLYRFYQGRGALRTAREVGEHHWELALGLAHPHSVAMAQHYAAFLHYGRREVPTVLISADTLLAEAYRLQGALLLRQDPPDAAQVEACFQRALTVARRQQADRGSCGRP